MSASSQTPSTTTHSNPFRIFWAITVETLRETRGFVTPVLIFSGGFVLVLIGRKIPSGLDLPGGLAGAFSYGGTSLALSFMAMALGAWSLASDERSGFRGVLLSKPASGALYFTGRFMGLAVRLTLILGGTLLINGCLVQILDRDAEFFRTVTPQKYRSGNEDQPAGQRLLLAPKGVPAEWRFDAAKLESRRQAGVQFRLRPRYPRDKALKSELPIEVIVSQGSRTLAHETVTLKNRKSLSIPFELHGVEAIHVRLAVTGGQNFIELAGNGCVLVQGGARPVQALLHAGLSFLPLLLLILCTGLVFSSFVSTGTAFLACAVLSLLVVTAPSLAANLDLVAAGAGSHSCPACNAPSSLEGAIEHDHGEAGRFVKTMALAGKQLLSMLPDLENGAGVDRLAKNEISPMAELWRAWRGVLAHLAVMVLLGAFLTGRRKSC